MPEGEKEDGMVAEAAAAAAVAPLPAVVAPLPPVVADRLSQIYWWSLVVLSLSPSLSSSSRL